MRKFYRIVIRPKGEFTSFRNQDVGKKGGLERLAGHRRSGSWDTEAWLVSKDDAHVHGGKLIITNPKIKLAIARGTSGAIVHIKDDTFHAHPRRNIPEKSKPTLAMRKAEMKNIKKAQMARKKK